MTTSIRNTITVLTAFVFAGACGGGDFDDVHPVTQASINGVDDRVNISEAAPFVRELAKGVLSMHHRGWVVQNTNGTYALLPTSSNGLCPDERFASEVPRSGCSAFLVATDVVATARHCIRAYTSIDIVRFVLGFDDVSGYAPDFQHLPAENIFAPTEVVYEDSELDVIALRLDRPTPPRAKPFRISGVDIASLPSHSRLPVSALGFPLGLPMKFTTNAAVQNARARFDTNLDIQMGNSGSAIFDANTFEIYGVLSGGAQDVVWDGAAQCYRYYRCPAQAYCREIGHQTIGLRPSVTPAGAPLDDFDLFGKFVVGAPAVTTVSNGHEYIVATADDGRIHWRVKNAPAELTSWQEIPGSGRSPSAPAITEFRGLLYVLVRGGDDQLYQTTMNVASGAWAGSWTLVAPPPASSFWPPYQVADAPTAFSLRTVQAWDGFVRESLVLMVRSKTGRVFQRTFQVQTTSLGTSTQSWGDWGLIWTDVLSPPRAIALNDRAFVFARTTGNVVRRKTFSNCWHPSGCFDSEVAVPGAPLTRSEPGAIPRNDNLYWLIVRGPDDKVMKIDGDGSGSYLGSWAPLHMAGRTFAGPTGTRAWGTWWLYTTGADRRVYRF